MRTTLDLDDRVLAAARSMARTRGTSLGRVVSELALKGLEADVTGGTDTRVDVSYSSFPVIVAPAEHVVTEELIATHRDE